MNETLVTVVGNVASDMATKRVGSEEHLLVGFRVASSQRRWDRAGECWVDGDRFSAWVSCWRRLGEGVVTSLVKGDPVVVTGRLSVREYEVGGERRYSTEIAANSVGPDLARSSAVVTRRRAVSADASAGSGVASPDMNTPASLDINTPASFAGATTDDTVGADTVRLSAVSGPLVDLSGPGAFGSGVSAEVPAEAADETDRVTDVLAATA